MSAPRRDAAVARTDEDTVDRPAPPERRELAIALGVLAAACLLIAALSRSWLANPLANTYELGPLGARMCDEGCSNVSNAELVAIIAAYHPGESPPSGVFAPLGWVVLGLAMLAALGLIGASALAAARRRPDLPVSPASLALLSCMLAIVAGCVFVATKPGPAGELGVAWGFWTFGAGCVVGIGAAQLLARAIRPTDPDLLADAIDPDEFPS